MDIRIVGSSPRIYTEALIGGSAWSSLSLTYSFPTAADQYSGYPVGAPPLTTFTPLNASQQTAVRSILDSISTFTPLTFTELSGGTGELRFGMSADFEDDVAARAFLPSPSPEGGDSWYRNADYNLLPQRGNDAWHTFMHEIGHALGLAHPHEVADGKPGMPGSTDSMPYTVMSYRAEPDGEFGWVQSFMREDIAALQFIYGANYDHNSTNTTYRWDPVTGEMSINGVGQGRPGESRVFQAIWDGGGIDTYDLSNHVGTDYGTHMTGVEISLHPGGRSLMTHDTRETGGPTYWGQVFNALLFEEDERSLIENVIGSRGSDRISGNDAANMLRGGDGFDSLLGGLGDDTLYGDAGDDRLEGEAGDDRLFGGAGIDTLVGGEGADRLDGGADDDQLSGWEGDDTLVGGDGDDHLDGYSGDDILEGGGGNDTLDGGEGDDRLVGGDGDDVLGGGEGADVLTGGKGNDNYFVHDDLDTIVELPGEGEDTLTTGISITAPDGIENIQINRISELPIHVRGNAANNTIHGDRGDDIIEGGEGDDVLSGDFGDDILDGGDGDDLLSGYLHDDILIGGEGFDTAVIETYFADALITTVADRVVVTNFSTGRDELVGIEAIRFVDRTVLVENLSTDFIMLADSGWKGSIEGSGKIFGTAGVQDIAIRGADSTIELDASFNQGGDRIDVPGNAALYSAALFGAVVRIDGGVDGPMVHIPVGEDPLDLTFADGSRPVHYEAGLAWYSPGQVLVGSQGVPAPSIDSPAEPNPDPVVTDPSAFARLILFRDSDVELGGNYQVYGSETADLVEISAAGRYEFDASFNRGVDRITLNEEAAAFTARLDGSKAELSSGALTLSVPIGTVGMVLDFDGDSRVLRYDADTAQVWLGGDLVDTTGSQLAAALMNSVVV